MCSWLTDTVTEREEGCAAAVAFVPTSAVLVVVERNSAHRDLSALAAAMATGPAHVSRVIFFSLYGQ